MRLLYSFFAVLLCGGGLLAQAGGIVLFETRSCEADLVRQPADGAALAGINICIIDPDPNFAPDPTGGNVGNPDEFPCFAMTAGPGPRTQAFYTHDDEFSYLYTVRNGAGNGEMRWFFEAVYDVGGTLDTIRERLDDNRTGETELEIAGCEIFPRAPSQGPPFRRYFVNGPQDRAIRAKLGSCLTCGDQEWTVTVDTRSFGDVVNNLAFVPASGRHMSFNSFPNFNLRNNQDGTWTGRFNMTNPEYIVYSFSANFAVAEAQLLAPDLSTKRCGIFDFGSREYFQGAGTPNMKSSSLLWASYSTDLAGTVVDPFTASQTRTATSSFTGPDGFTTYLDGGTKLIGISWGSAAPAAPGDVSIVYGAQQATPVPNQTGFVVSNGDAALLNRNFRVSTPATGTFPVRYYLTDADLNALRTATGDATLTVNDLFFYAEPSNSPSAPANTSSESVTIYQNGNPDAKPFTGAAVEYCSGTTGTDLVATFEVEVEAGTGFAAAGGFSGGAGATDMNAAILPVELTQLSAEPTGKSIMVKWETAREESNDYFAVEHSTDGAVFREVGRVAGAGFSEAATRYAFDHRGAASGLNYYRLRQLDLDGTAHLSNVVSAVYAGPAAAVSLYPNPVSDRLYLSAAASGEVTVRDLSGRSVLRVAATALGQGGLDVSELAAGVYFLATETAEEATVLRFVKR